MSIRSALVVFLRIIILVMLLDVILAWMASFNVGSSLTPVGGIIGAFAILALVTSPFLVIFIFAESVVRLLAPAGGKSAESEVLTTERLQIVAFSAVGIYLMFWMCLDTLGFFYFLITAAALDHQSQGVLAFPTEQKLRLVFGWLAAIYIFFGAPALRKVVSGMRGIGNADR
jgi:hypothetical protein